MIEEQVKKFVLSACYGDVVKQREQNKTKFSLDILEKYEAHQWSYMVEMMIIVIKSLVPSKEEVAVDIDDKRFEEEIKLWQYYRHGGNKTLLNAINASDERLYWEGYDHSIYSRLFPLAVVNQNFEGYKKAVSKNILYTTGNIEQLIEAIVLGKVVYLLMEGNRDIDEILSTLKEEVIHLSQKNFLENFDTYYRVDRKLYPGKYTLDFERQKIACLNKLNGIKNKDGFHILEVVLDYIRSEHLEEGADKHFFVAGIVGLIQGYNDDIQIKDQTFIENLCVYLTKLRKSRVTPESLKITNYHLPDIFSFEEGETFNHTLLKASKVLKILDFPKYRLHLIMTRTGFYRFIKVKHPS